MKNNLPVKKNEIPPDEKQLILNEVNRIGIHKLNIGTMLCGEKYQVFSKEPNLYKKTITFTIIKMQTDVPPEIAWFREVPTFRVVYHDR